MEGARDDPPAQTHLRKNYNTRKRKLSLSDGEDLQNRFNIGVPVRKLRSNVMEVLETPDFRNCKVANEIRKDLKQVLDLYKQMILQTDPPINLVTEQQTVLNENAFSQQASHEFQEGKKAAKPLKTEYPADKSTDVNCSMPNSSSEWKLNGFQLRSGYVVGASINGKNFITFGSSKPVYYGPTKDSYMRRQMKSVVGASVNGKNFITFGSSKPVYYGPTKDSYLRRQMKSE